MSILPTFGGSSPKSTLAVSAPNLKVHEIPDATNLAAIALYIYILYLYDYPCAVQWSTHPDFMVAGGEVELRDTAWKRGATDELNEISVTVTDCPSNARCYFRVAAGNLSGYGSFKATLPSSVLLSGIHTLTRMFLKNVSWYYNLNFFKICKIRLALLI